jgi:hypothetical protein
MAKVRGVGLDTDIKILGNKLKTANVTPILTGQAAARRLYWCGAI